MTFCSCSRCLNKFMSQRFASGHTANFCRSVLHVFFMEHTCLCSWVLCLKEGSHIDQGCTIGGQMIAAAAMTG